MASRQSIPEAGGAGLPPRLRDIHHHLLYGLDDGPADAQTMEAMIDLAVRDGAEAVIATTHASPGVEAFALAKYRERLEEARAYCRRRQYTLRILEGAEVLYSPSAADELLRGRIPTLNGTAYVLVEWPCDAAADGIAQGLRCLNNEGLIPVLAHAERLTAYWRRPGELIRLREQLDIRVQLNAHALLRPDILRGAGLVRHLMKAGAVDYVASDAHNVAERRTRLSEACERIARDWGVRRAEELLRDNQRGLTG
ncbi:MAG: CpsB/CapC family capsule biosynthesis tyrosine phosphatase [Aristaeellaceae bacterium]